MINLKKKYLVWRLDRYSKIEKKQGFLNSSQSKKMLDLRDELYTIMWGRNSGFFGTYSEGNPWRKSSKTEIDSINEDQIEVLPSYYDEDGTNRWQEDKPWTPPRRIWYTKVGNYTRYMYDEDYQKLPDEEKSKYTLKRPK